MFFQRSGCEQDDGDVAGNVVLFHLLAELQAVHYGHHHVRYNQVGHLFAGELQSAFAVLGFQYAVLPLQDGVQIGADIGIVIDDEHCGSILVGLHISRRFGRRKILSL